VDGIQSCEHVRRVTEPAHICCDREDYGIRLVGAFLFRRVNTAERLTENNTKGRVASLSHILSE
jgi:hypothetical protein